MIIVIVLKLTRGSTCDKAPVTSQNGQLGLIRVNVKMKVFIIIILKPDLKVELRQGQVTSQEDQPRSM